jgi:hypothetical protein
MYKIEDFIVKKNYKIKNIQIFNKKLYFFILII